MKKIKKSCLILVLLCMGTLRGWAQSGDFGTDNALHWDLTGGTLTISGTGEMPSTCGISYPYTLWREYCVQTEPYVVEGGIALFYQITNAVIQEGVTNIGGCAFFGFPGLTSVTVPQSVTSIDEEAFGVCRGLTSINIPASVTQIGSAAFFRCTGLQTVTVNWDSPLQLIGGSGNYFGEVAVANVQLQVPKGTKALYEKAPVWQDFGSIVEFDACIIAQGTTGNLSWVLDCDSTLTISGTGAMPDFCGHSYTDIPWLEYCAQTEPYVVEGGVALFYQIKNVVIQEGVTNIGGCSFWGCAGLTSITIPQSVTSIGESAFGFCSGLTSINIPASVTAIGSAAFQGCTGFQTVTVNWDTPLLLTWGNGNLWGGNLFGGDDTVNVQLLVPKGTKALYEEAPVWKYFGSIVEFGACIVAQGTTGNLSWVLDCDSTLTISGTGAMPDYCGHSYTNIPWLEYCAQTEPYVVEGGVALIYQIKNVVIQEGVTNIGGCSFWGCAGLTSITIPQSVTSIGESAFYWSGLTSIDIPASVTSIEVSAFGHCYALTSLKVESTNLYYASENGILFNKEKTKLILFPERKSGSYIIPTSVTTIGSGSFSYCSGLTSIDIPASVTTIGLAAFYGCTGLQTVTVNWDSPLPLNVNDVIFGEVPTANIQLQVPKGTKALYKNAPVWQDFNIVESGAPDVASIALNKKSLSLKIGESETLTATVLPATADQTVVWKSGNTIIATVNNGAVKALAVGNTYIVAKAGDGIHTDTCWVTVTRPPAERYVEYFFDADPGFGKALFAGEPTQTGEDATGVYKELTFKADIAALSKGVHTLYVRAKTPQGWSQTQKRLFVKTTLAEDPEANIDYVEYFIDSDPGYGKGTPADLSNYAGIYLFDMSMKPLTTGIHTIYVRARNVEGVWSQVANRAFVKTTPYATSLWIQAVEYYLDADPGTGNGIDAPFDIEDGAAVFTVDLNAVAAGEHTLHIRWLNEFNQWEAIGSHVFTVITIPNGIENMPVSDEITVYPNPVSEMLFIKNEHHSIEGIEIIDMNGRTVFMQRTRESDVISIPVRNYPSGLFIVKVRTTSGNTRTLKIIKK